MPVPVEPALVAPIQTAKKDENVFCSSKTIERSKKFGLIESEDYPNYNYYENECSWIFLAESGRNILLSIDVFEIKANNDARFRIINMSNGKIVFDQTSSLIEPNGSQLAFDHDIRTRG